MDTSTPTLAPSVAELEALALAHTLRGDISARTFKQRRIDAVARDLAAMAYGGPFDPDEEDMRVRLVCANSRARTNEERRAFVRDMVLTKDMGAPLSDEEMRDLQRSRWEARRAATAIPPRVA